MPYARNSELPEGVRNALPGEAQTVFREAVNDALDRGLSEDRAFASAWGAVKHGWEKGSDGRWIKKMAEKFEHRFEVSKIDEDQNLVFGWAYIAEDATGKTMYDHSDEFTTGGELEKMQYEYVLQKRVGGEMHEREVGALVESVVMTKEKQRAMGLPDGSLPVGVWVGFKVHSEVFAKVKDGTYTAFSIGGKAEKVAHGP